MTPKQALGVLIIAATDLLLAIDGATDQFEPEVQRLQNAIAEADKARLGGAQ
jgi:hypothetical protein